MHVVKFQRLGDVDLCFEAGPETSEAESMLQACRSPPIAQRPLPGSQLVCPGSCNIQQTCVMAVSVQTRSGPPRQQHNSMGLTSCSSL